MHAAGAFWNDQSRTIAGSICPSTTSCSVDPRVCATEAACISQSNASYDAWLGMFTASPIVRHISPLPSSARCWELTGPDLRSQIIGLSQIALTYLTVLLAREFG